MYSPQKGQKVQVLRAVTIPIREVQFLREDQYNNEFPFFKGVDTSVLIEEGTILTLSGEYDEVHNAYVMNEKIRYYELKCPYEKAITLKREDFKTISVTKSYLDTSEELKVFCGEPAFTSMPRHSFHSDENVSEVQRVSNGDDIVLNKDVILYRNGRIYLKCEKGLELKVKNANQINDSVIVVNPFSSGSILVIEHTAYTILRKNNSEVTT